MGFFLVIIYWLSRLKRKEFLEVVSEFFKSHYVERNLIDDERIFRDMEEKGKVEGCEYIKQKELSDRVKGNFSLFVSLLATLITFLLTKEEWEVLAYLLLTCSLRVSTKTVQIMKTKSAASAKGKYSQRR